MHLDEVRPDLFLQSPRNPTSADSTRGQTIVHQVLDARVNDAFWTQRLNSPAGQGSAVKMGTSAPTRDRWQFVAVEIASFAGSAQQANAQGSTTIAKAS
jgi:hypothetical protein